MTATAPPVAPSDEPAAQPVRRFHLRRFAPLLLAGAAGLLLYVTFPPRELPWLAPLSFALFGIAVHGRRLRAGFGLGLVFGLAYLVPLLSWTGVDVGPLPWLALAVAEALVVAFAGMGIAYVSRLPLWPLWASGVWIADEALRARFPFGGFPWGKVAFGQPSGVFLPLASLGGTPLLGFAVVLCGFGLGALALRVKKVRGRADVRLLRDRGVVAAAAFTVAPVLAGAAAMPLVATSAEAGTARVALIQGNVPRMGLDFNAQRRAVLDYHVRETMKLAAKIKTGKVKKPDLVLWPENSSDIDPYVNIDAYQEIQKAAEAVGAPISVGAVVTDKNGDERNQLILWDPKTGPGATYNKRHLQPFGEYMPYRGFFRIFSKDVDRAGNFKPGTKAVVFDMAGTKVGNVTCYEAAFDDVVRDQVDAGAQILSVPSNNATFERSQMTYQQLAMDRVRAVEHGRAVMVPVTSGVSAVIRPDGSIAQKTGMFEADTLLADVPRRTTKTLATRAGVWPEALLVGIGVGGLAWAVVRSRRGRRTTA
ncbi:apolipoprotein N-acyltransferase [Streptomyces sp. VRA16 Mangrove soil]|uniref:apolipoprotein N-acyltransferase n=1 Tax=Streptomyces sp. VRA16 Mangrove soil TaxID=2817434 RepID=UPI001A9F4BD3|nr:apolipoprotein N-acyltransferase [Streptomyces sp. VRA16 Mangrove soil]MBO1334392.1 apolipoprotein N-acyltransferase [Streptomyces sp. VRA16 Mangrove soil]